MERPVEDDLRTGKTGSFLDHIGDKEVWVPILIILLVGAVMLLLARMLDKEKRKEHFKREEENVLKTRLFGFNQRYKTVTKGAVGRTLMGGMLGGDLGALLGAMSAREENVPVGYEMARFLVFYKDGTKKIVDVPKDKELFKLYLERLEDTGSNPPAEKEEGGKGGSGV